jgi:hypothetical protein
VTEAGAQVEDLGDEKYNLINSALSALNVVAIYGERRYINREVVLKYWGATIARTPQAAQGFLAHHLVQDGSPPWPQLDELARVAQARREHEAATAGSATSAVEPS